MIQKLTGTYDVYGDLARKHNYAKVYLEQYVKAIIIHI